jgi:predicted PurR-regulated permease PerM
LTVEAAHASGPGTPGRRSLSVSITFRTLLLAATIVLIGWAFVNIRSTILTLFLALFVALVLEPVVALLERKSRFGRGASSTIVVLGLIVLAVVLAILVIAPFVDQVRDFVDALPSIVQDIRNSSIGSWIDEHSQGPEQAQESVKKIAQGIGAALGGVLGFSLSAFSIVLSLVSAIFLTLFLLIDMPRLVGAVDSLLDPSGAQRLQRIWPAIVTAVSRTMLGNIAISIICGTIYGVSAWALGLPYPLVLALIAGFLDLIPMVGATIAGAILVLVGLTQSVTAAVIMLAIVLIYQQLENYLLQPTILGKAADVSGFFVMASVIVFGALAGAVGAIIAVPIVASIQIVVREVTAARREEMARRRAAEAAVARPSV